MHRGLVEQCSNTKETAEEGRIAPSIEIWPLAFSSFWTFHDGFLAFLGVLRGCNFSGSEITIS
jgi:hypothetical protein